MTSPIQIPEVRFSKRTLPNGLDVITRRQGDLPIVAVNLWYHVGSKNEPVGQRGFAHLFEHLMFEGSEHYPHDFFKPLQPLGANINGSTSSDRTNYIADIPTAHLELVLAMESDRMGHFLPALSAEKLRIQKDVVKNEYRQNYANRPYGQVWRLLAETQYPDGHPYNWLTIGRMEDVEAAGLDDVEGFFRRFYVPSNASLCVVGDIDEDEAAALAERYFGPIPGGSKAGRPNCPPVELKEDRSVVFHDRVELEKFYFSWHTVPQFEPYDTALDTLAYVLSRGKASRLYRRLVMENEFLQDVSAYQSGRELAGTFGISGTLRPGRTLDEVRRTIDLEIEDLAHHGPRPEELERVRASQVSSFLYSLENVGGFGGVADRLNAYNTYLGDPARLRSELEEALAVTAEEVKAAAGRFLADQPRISLLATGKKSVTTLPPLDRTTAPKPAPAIPFRPPVPEVIKLRSGLNLWVLPRRDLPLVSASFVLPGGAIGHSAARGGLASLTSDVLDEGTRTRTTHEIALEVESIGSHLSTSCGWDGSYISLHCIASQLKRTLEIAVDVLRNATFPDSEWSRIKRQTLASLQAEKNRPEALAGRAFLRALYGKEHSFGIPVDGDEQTVTSLERSDLVRFHETHHLPAGSALVVAGDVDVDTLVPLLDRLLEGWEGSASSEVEQPRLAEPDRTRLIILNRPGSTQAVVRVGQVGTHRLDPDFTDLMVFNQILGGQFTSRLNAKLREEKGFTYGVRSGFDFRRAAGPFSISSSLQSDRLAEALADLRREVQDMIDSRPPLDTEIDDARRALIEGHARHFETPSALVSRFAGLFLYGLPPDHHRGFADRVNAVSAGSALEAARRRIKPGSLTTVVIADAAQVAPPLKALEWGDVIELSDPTDLTEIR